MALKDIFETFYILDSSLTSVYSLKLKDIPWYNFELNGLCKNHAYGRHKLSRPMQPRYLLNTPARGVGARGLSNERPGTDQP